MRAKRRAREKRMKRKRFTIEDAAKTYKLLIKNGSGVRTFPGGAHYEGRLVNGQFHGR